MSWLNLDDKGNFPVFSQGNHIELFRITPENRLQFSRATKRQREKGWTVNCDFIKGVKRHISDEDVAQAPLQMEDVEAILLALERYIESIS